MERLEYEKLITNVIDGNYDKAVTDAEEIVAKGDFSAYEALSDINVAMYEMTGDKRYLSRAKEFLDKAQEKGIIVTTKKFSIILSMGDFASAARMVTEEKDMITKMFLESLLLMEKQDIEQAKITLEKLLSYAPKISEPYIIFSKLLYSDGEYIRAIEVLKRGMELIPDELHKTEVAEEYLRTTTLYNAPDKALLLGSFSLENAKWVLIETDRINAKTPEEFLNMIGIGMNEENHLIVVMPKDEKLFELVKDDFLSLLPEGVDYRDLEFMISQLKASIG